jgi:hypothetical protein
MGFNEPGKSLISYTRSLLTRLDAPDSKVASSVAVEDAITAYGARPPGGRGGGGGGWNKFSKPIKVINPDAKLVSPGVANNVDWLNVSPKNESPADIFSNFSTIRISRISRISLPYTHMRWI